MFRGFGQEEPSEARYVAMYQAQTGYTPAVVPQLVEPGGSVSYIYGSNSAEKTTGLLPVLDSLVKGVAGVATSWFQYDVAKAQAKAGVPVYRAGLAPAYQRPTTLPAGLSTGNLLLLAGAGVGVMLLMKRRGGTSRRRARKTIRRRRR